MMHGGLNIPNIVVQSMLKNKKQLFNICHINACSIFPRMAYFRKLINGTSLSEICVSESRLNKSHTNHMIQLEGYNIIRSDRTVKNKSIGGGVCIYIKSNFKFKIISKIVVNNNKLVC